MGQTHGSPSKSKQNKPKGDKSQRSSRASGSSNKNNGKKIKKPVQRIELKNVLRPNGIFPPEILELILVHTQEYDLIQATMSCKLWMETSIQVFKRLYLRNFCSNPQSVPENFDYVTAFINHSMAKKNMRQGIYWAEEVALAYGCRGFLGGVSYTWTCNGNQIAINFDKTNHTSYGPYTMHTEGLLYDIEKRSRRPINYGTHLWNGKSIVPQHSNFTSWEWNTCTVSLEEGKKAKKEIKIEREHKFIRPDTGDPYQALSSPERLMDAFPNLDGSPQIMIWDRSINLGTQDYMCEVYDMNTGKQLYKRELKKYCDRIIGFYKTSVICKRKSDVTFFDMTNGNELGTLPLFLVYHIHNHKLIIAEESSPAMVSVWDLETMQRSHKFDVDTIEPEEIQQGSSNIGGLAFDNWKLVVHVSSTHNSWKTLVFDMTDNFKKLTQICGAGERNRNVRLALPSNGSIVIGGSRITVVDFNHPYLYADIPIAFCSTQDPSTVKIKQQNVDAVHLFEEAKKLLQKEKLSELMATTYFNLVGFNHDYTARVTCISAVPDRQIDYYYERVGRYGIMTKIPNWKKLFGLGSVISLTSADLSQVTTERGVMGRPGVSDPCVMIFEEFDSDNGTWKITEPHWPDHVVALVEKNS